MANILFPGRHLLQTKFQQEYLSEVLGSPVDQLDMLEGTKPKGNLDKIVFAITSSNQDHSRYNPIPFHVRAIGVDRFARQFPAGHRII
ncbi:MAG: hypothetical protein KJ922_06315, partial [Nanoarchaeota archaeon]|nr:hypothetical protein [Nanoarchaeota archaeon]